MIVPPDKRMNLSVVLKRFDAPDEVRQFTKGRLEIVRIGGLSR